ncbi:hypothetical protein [Rhodocyclus tenuis]|uniref:Protochlamydia outer membrane protein domain-containing protein n=1 Tax=Rhodocyclus tenuis TaxID=1066 RepID=A0A840GKM4_RHOTE|nr:hypothetical protein [Rhodocyclus tenuis]MBB4248709.1 hypothetical protein [Rhodocyclus tenuis]
MSLRERIAALAILSLLISQPVLADPFAEGSMTVFAGGDARETRLAIAEAPTLTVFDDDGPRAVNVDANWPKVQGEGHFKLSLGQRHETTRWNIGVDGGPNVLSELRWQVPASEVRVDGVWTHTSGFTVKSFLAYAQSFAGGEVQDSDYLLDNRQAEFSRSYASPTGSRMLDISIGAGWKLPLGRTASLTPMLGFARYDSRYRMRDGRQVLSDYGLAPPLGTIGGLDSKYNPVWNSVWFGIDGQLQATGKLALRSEIKKHYFRYEAEANWNLRSSYAHPVSFVHQGDGSGWSAVVGADWQLARDQRLTLDLSKRDFRLRNGTDTTYLSDGSSSSTRLNEVISDSWSAHLGYRVEY